jgi:hypothetical protein
VDDLYKASEQSVAFWIDTVCVPLSPDERTLAIIDLKKTYSEADKVVVLDRTLLDAPSDMECTENNIRITSSKWMRRLWTFEEGVLSKSLHFQLSDKALTPDDLKSQRLEHWEKQVRKLCSQHVSYQGPFEQTQLRSKLALLLRGAYELESILPFEADREIRKARDDLKSIDEDSARLDLLIENIKWRTTSRPEDEFVCLANLLGRGITKEMMLRPYSERMKWLFSSLERVSTPIIFHDRPRVELPGYRWIPLSLLNARDALQIRGDSQRVKPSPDGLRVTYPGLRLSPESKYYTSNPQSPLFIVGNDKSRAYVIEPVGPNVTSRAGYQDSQLAMIFEDFEDRSMEYVPMVRAVIVKILDEEQYVIKARIEHSVLFRRLKGGAIPPSACFASAKAFPKDQTWQVG